MDNNLKFDTKILKKYLPTTLTSIGVIGLAMDCQKIQSKRLKCLDAIYGRTGEHYERYKERVLKSLYTNNKRKMKGIPMRRRVVLKKWMKTTEWWRALK